MENSVVKSSLAATDLRNAETRQISHLLGGSLQFSKVISAL